MKKFHFDGLTVDQLVQRFTDLALAQDQAERDDDIRAVNRLFRAIEGVESELKQRTGDRRAALLPLYDHANMNVRFRAVLATLAVAPQQARAMLEIIRTSGHYPQAADAGFMISGLDDGSYRPT